MSYMYALKWDLECVEGDSRRGDRVRELLEYENVFINKFTFAVFFAYIS